MKPLHFKDCTPPFEVYVYTDAIVDNAPTTVSRGKMSKWYFVELSGMVLLLGRIFCWFWKMRNRL